MDLDIDGLLREAKEQIGTLGARCVLLQGQIEHLKKHCDAQAKELAELRKKQECASS